MTEAKQEPGPDQLRAKAVEEEEQPINELELLNQIASIYQQRLEMYEVSKALYGPSKARERELRRLQIITDIVHTVSCDKPGYVEFFRRVRRKHARYEMPKPPEQDVDVEAESGEE